MQRISLTHRTFINPLLTSSHDDQRASRTQSLNIIMRNLVVRCDAFKTPARTSSSSEVHNASHRTMLTTAAFAPYETATVRVPTSRDGVSVPARPRTGSGPHRDPHPSPRRSAQGSAHRVDHPGVVPVDSRERSRRHSRETPHLRHLRPKRHAQRSRPW